MIVKNAELSLQTCLDSARAVADEIIVVDTGSTDATPRIAAGNGAKVVPFDFTFVDFSAARNRALASATGKWIFVLDADETLDPSGIPLIREFVTRDENAGYYVERRNRSTTDYAVRLFPNRPDYRYRGRVHETVDAAILAGGGRLRKSAIRIDHAVSSDKSKNHWYIEILKEEIAADPSDTTRLDFLAAEYHQLEMFDEATEIAERIVGARPLDASAHLNAGIYHLIYRPDLPRARADFNRALALRPGYPEALSFLETLDAQPVAVPVDKPPAVALAVPVSAGVPAAARVPTAVPVPAAVADAVAPAAAAPAAVADAVAPAAAAPAAVAGAVAPAAGVPAAEPPAAAVAVPVPASVPVAGRVPAAAPVLDAVAAAVAPDAAVPAAAPVPGAVAAAAPDAAAPTVTEPRLEGAALKPQMNTESLRIATQLRHAFAGEPWHGSPLSELLTGVDAEQAFARPITSAHSIGELVLHIDLWLTSALDATKGIPMPKLDGTARDWAVVNDSDAKSWADTRKSLFDRAEQLAHAIEILPDVQLMDTVPGRDYDFYFLFHGIVQHSLYHAGQIAILAKALRSPTP